MEMQRILDRISSGEPLKFFLDTDTANEIDDQFAITYAMLADNIDLVGISAALWGNSHTVIESYNEIQRVKNMTDWHSTVPVYMGADHYLKDRNTYSPSEACDAIISACHSSDDLIFCAAIGCFTNVASAILKDPSITENLVVEIIGAHDIDSVGHAREYNLEQDVASAQVIMESGCGVILLPALGGTDKLKTTVGEVAYYLEEKNIPIGNYLAHLMRESHDAPKGSVRSQTHIIWDIASLAVLRNKGFDRKYIRNAVTVNDDMSFKALEGKQMIYNTEYERDRIFNDLFSLILDKAAR